MIRPRNFALLLFSMLLLLFSVACSSENATVVSSNQKDELDSGPVTEFPDAESFLSAADVGRVLGREVEAYLPANSERYNCKVVREYKSRDNPVTRMTIFQIPSKLDDLKKDYPFSGQLLFIDDLDGFAENAFIARIRNYDRTAPIVSDVRAVVFSKDRYVISVKSDSGFGDLPENKLEIVNGVPLASENELVELALIIDKHPFWRSQDVQK